MQLAIRHLRQRIGRRWIIGAVGLGVSVVLAAGPRFLVAAPNPDAEPAYGFFRIGTGTTSGAYFSLGGLIANAISNPPGSRPCDRGGSCGVPGLIAVAQATSGAVQNLALLRQGALEAALSQSDLIDWAYTGTGIDQGKPPYGGLRAVANLYTEALHLVVRADGPIRGLRDLRGKAVSLGEEGSGTLVEARLLLKAYGVKESEIRARFLDPGTAGDRLAAGDVDAFFVVGGAPLGVVSDTAARVPIRLIPFDDAVAERFLRTQPFYVGTLIGADVYPGVPLVRTLGIPAQLVVRSDIPDGVVYGITRALWHESTLHLLEASGPTGRQIALAEAVRSLRVPLHPGAERYYRDVGLVGGSTAGAGEASDPVAARP